MKSYLKRPRTSRVCKIPTQTFWPANRPFVGYPILEQLVEVQPMNHHAGEVVYLDYVLTPPEDQC